MAFRCKLSLSYFFWYMRLYAFRFLAVAQEKKKKMMKKKKNPEKLVEALSDNPGGSKSKKRKRGVEDDPHANTTKDVMGRAKEVQLSLPPESPTLLRPILQSHVSGGFWLGLPKEFCKMHLSSRKDATILLEDEKGQEYKTKYHYRWEKSGLSTGWKGFCKAHDLVVGDVLVFQLLYFPTKFKVYIVRSNEVDRVVRSKKAVPEVGQSSNSRSLKFKCEICVERKHTDDSFQVQGCTHSYCTDCITQYIISKLDQNITSIKCPVAECEGQLEPDICCSILPDDVFERWGKALCEGLIPGSEKFYCPFKDCSAILIKEGSEVVKESECPHCYRLFCAQCNTPWHAEIECEEFQRLNKDEREREDIMLMKLAEKNKWKRCPKCRFYVQKRDGCHFVICRCGVEFCYSCGKQPSISHYCKYCRH